jgi:hypothetical protein
MNWDVKQFKEKLEANHNFPDTYMFKFIVPLNKKEVLVELLPKVDLKIKTSATNKFVSITLSMEMESSDSVLDIYNQAYQIEGIIAI